MAAYYTQLRFSELGLKGVRELRAEVETLNSTPSISCAGIHGEGLGVSS